MKKKTTYILIVGTFSAMYYLAYWLLNEEFGKLGSAIIGFATLILFSFFLFYVVDSIIKLKEEKKKNPIEAYNAPILRIEPYAQKATLLCLLVLAILYSIAIVKLLVKANMIPSDLSTFSTVISSFGTIGSMIFELYKNQPKETEKNLIIQTQEDSHF